MSSPVPKVPPPPARFVPKIPNKPSPNNSVLGMPVAIPPPPPPPPPQHSIKQLKEQILDNALFLYGPPTIEQGGYRIITLERGGTYQSLLVHSSTTAPEAPFTQPEWQRLILAYGDWFLGRYEALEGLLVSTEKTIRRRVVGYTAEERRVMELLTPVGVI
ncbi:hypothetical protein DFH27DRAFT_522911 [Peziza echinospora]|nr:hypothetical protein DFH27DRAFT_522911 [Peziza echinospora]